MDYPVIDIEGTGIRIRELIRESGHTVSEVSEYLEQVHHLYTDT